MMKYRKIIIQTKQILMTINILIGLPFLQVFALTTEYDFFCPSQAHWSLRAKSICMTQINYSCLFDVNLQVNVYRDKCIRPRIVGPGYKYVFQPNPNRKSCSLSRYQPYIFNTTGYSECALLKSNCYSQGQKTNTDGTTRSDRTCTCNSEAGYNFISNPEKECYCNPSNEDCSCYLGISPNNRTIDCKAMSFSTEMNIYLSHIHENRLQKTKAVLVMVHDFDNFRYNIGGIKNEYRAHAVAYILILVVLYPFIVGIYMLQRNMRQWINTPKDFEIVECTESSITVEWVIKGSDNCLNYDISYRLRDSNNPWEEQYISAKVVQTKGNYFNTIENLSPDEYYEMKICSIDSHGVKSQYTEPKWKSTLPVAPKNIKIEKSTDSSITVELDFDGLDNCHVYQLVYRIKDSNNPWEEKYIHSKDVPTKGNYLYKIEKLSPNEYYELKICSVGSHGVNSQYTEPKLQSTLPVGVGEVTVLKVGKYSSEQNENKKEEQVVLDKKDYVPENIREVINHTINSWKEKSKQFIRTRAYAKVFSEICSKSCVVVTGCSGSGKSAIVHQVSVSFAMENHFEIITISNPEDLKKYINPGRKTVFVLDDLCGTFTANAEQLQRWSSITDVMDLIHKDDACKILFSCRLQVYHDPAFSLLKSFDLCECNITSEELCLTTHEKEKIFKSYLSSKMIPKEILSRRIKNFPLLCQQYSIKQNDHAIEKYFERPYEAYKIELNDLKEHAPEMFSGLFLCVLFNNQLKETDFQILSPEFKTTVKDVCEHFGLVTSTAASIHKQLDTLVNTYVNKREQMYEICHDNLFDYMAYYFGEMSPKCFIDHADSSLLRERFLWKNAFQSDICEIEDMVYSFDNAFLPFYIERMIADWSIGKVSEVFFNRNMLYSSFREEFIQKLKVIVDQKATDLANMKNRVNDDFHSGNTPLIISCLHGYDDLLEWLIDKNANVDDQREDGATALCLACEKNHLHAVLMLLKNNANVNLCTKEGDSPLGLACYFHGNISIIRELIERGASINEHAVNKSNMTPLFMACQQNFVLAVKVLLKNNADHSICLKNGISVLLVACQKRNTDIVRLLLENGAYPDIEKNDGNTPLFSASAMGFKDIAEQLLENGADLNKCLHSQKKIRHNLERTPETLNKIMQSWVTIAEDFGSDETRLYMSSKQRNTLEDVFDVVADSSPLHVACFMGHIEIVEFFLAQKQVCVDSKKPNGITPLYYAGLINHRGIIRVLKAYKADYNSRKEHQSQF